MFKYMRTWMGVVSGSLGGRDDGQPERQFRLYETLDEMAADKQTLTFADEVFYELRLSQSSIWDDDIKQLVIAARERQSKEAEKAEHEKKEAQFERLKKELGK